MCTTRQELCKEQQRHYERLFHYRHVRYMWVPYTSQVVVVVSNPSTTDASPPSSPSSPIIPSDENQVLSPTRDLCNLLVQVDPAISRAYAETLSFSQLRDELLDHSPLDLEHVKKVNAAEAQFWAASTGTRQGDSESILGFDCGGECIGQSDHVSASTRFAMYLRICCIYCFGLISSYWASRLVRITLI